MKKIRILVADDHALVRMGLSTLIGCEPDMKIVAEAEDGPAAVRLALQHQPDIVIMDMQMPGGGGLEASRQLRTRLPSAKILILTSFGLSADLSEALAMGVSGARMKGEPNEELLEAIRTIYAGGSAVSDEIARNTLQAPATTLTPRQQEILTHLARGLTNEQIGRVLGIRADRVKLHVRSILSKIGAANRTEAVVLAMKNHLLKI